MQADRALDRFILIFVGVVLATLGYLAWVIHITEYHWAHLYWVGLGVWGGYVLVHVEGVLKVSRDKEFAEIVEEWVRKGEPDEPLDLRK